jgi:hypothetical protein
VVIYRTDGLDAVKPKQVFYPLMGADLTQGTPNFNGLHVARDAHDSVNQYAIETHEIEYEVGLILAPGFPINTADAANYKAFDRSALTNASADMLKAYRYFVFDEAGLGHWDFTSGAIVTGEPTSLDDVFGKPKSDQAQYATLLRRAAQTLFAKDTAGNPRKARLMLSRDYPIGPPCVWDGVTGKGTFRDLADSGWKLDDDSLSIWINTDSPESWKIPKSDAGKVPGDVVRCVTSFATPNAANAQFTLMLVCVISSDKGIEAIASKRRVSPMKFPVTRHIEAKEHFRKQIQHISSPYNPGPGPVTVRDDTTNAQAEADALRLANEFPPIAGSFNVPWFDQTLDVGDLVSQINGRNISLNVAAGAPIGEGPRYPAVVGISVTCQNPQTTVYELHDQRVTPRDFRHIQ